MRVIRNQRRVVCSVVTAQILQTVGQQIKLARKRRHLTAAMAAERSGFSRTTLRKIEAGDASVAMGSYAALLDTMGLQEDLLLVARDHGLRDIVGDKEERPDGNSKAQRVLPEWKRNLQEMGWQIRAARKRRDYSVALIQGRSGLSRTTISAIEHGVPTVAIGLYARVLAAIGLRDDLTLLAKTDEYGRLLQDAEL